MLHIVNSLFDTGAIVVHLSQLAIYFFSCHTARACASGKIQNWFAHLSLRKPDTRDLSSLSIVKVSLHLVTVS